MAKYVNKDLEMAARTALAELLMKGYDNVKVEVSMNDPFFENEMFSIVSGTVDTETSDMIAGVLE